EIGKLRETVVKWKDRTNTCEPKVESTEKQLTTYKQSYTACEITLNDQINKTKTAQQETDDAEGSRILYAIIGGLLGAGAVYILKVKDKKETPYEEYED
ncbi:hypothetical protein GOV10_00935, partial [Candidatus Woesearchaeota archaeon]|nr:hypothetical protein [Candidatus Woesearchaeota archaeon]